MSFVVLQPIRSADENVIAGFQIEEANGIGLVIVGSNEPIPGGQSVFENRRRDELSGG